MKTIFEHGQYHCVLLDKRAKTDLPIFAEAKDLCYTDKVTYGDYDVKNPEEILKGMRRDRNFWLNSLTYPSLNNFLLFKDKEIIGMASTRIESSQHILFNGIHVLHAHRGQGLAELLYKARMHHTILSSNRTQAIAYIRPENIPSRRAAEKSLFERITPAETDLSILYNDNAFVIAPQEDEFLIYQRDLTPLRLELKPPQTIDFKSDFHELGLA